MSTELEDLGKLFLRLGVGGLLLIHGIDKVQNGIGFVTETMISNGLPAMFAYGAYIAEVVAPVLVLIGLFTRPAALIIALDMVFAILLVRRADLSKVTPGGAWSIEAEMLFLLGACAIACLGGGRFGLGTGRVR